MLLTVIPTHATAGLSAKDIRELETLMPNITPEEFEKFSDLYFSYDSSVWGKDAIWSPLPRQLTREEIALSDAFMHLITSIVKRNINLRELGLTAHEIDEKAAGTYVVLGNTGGFYVEPINNHPPLILIVGKHMGFPDGEKPEGIGDGYEGITQQIWIMVHEYAHMLGIMNEGAADVFTARVLGKHLRLDNEPSEFIYGGQASIVNSIQKATKDKTGIWTIMLARNLSDDYLFFSFFNKEIKGVTYEEFVKMYRLLGYMVRYNYDHFNTSDEELRIRLKLIYQHLYEYLQPQLNLKDKINLAQPLLVAFNWILNTKSMSENGETLIPLNYSIKNLSEARRIFSIYLNYYDVLIDNGDLDAISIPQEWLIQTANLETASSWAVTGLSSALEKGFIPPELLNNYKSAITRLEFCRMAVKWIEYRTGMSINSVLADRGLTRNINAFTDTRDSSILAAYALGIISGTVAPTPAKPGRFSPDSKLSREQAATMIRNVCRAVNMDVSDVTIVGFEDIESASNWAIDNIHFCYAKGIMSGTSITPRLFSPKATYTREQSIMTFDNIKLC